MTFEEKVNSIIGKPYSTSDYHCYHVVEFLIPNAPKIDEVALTLSSVKELNKKHDEVLELQYPEDECIVLMGNNDIMVHAGVSYKNGVVHNEVSGVKYEALQSIEKRFANIRYFHVN